MKRRGFLIAAGLVSGAWLVGCAGASRQRLRDGELPLADGQIALDGWIKLGVDGRVGVVMSRVEMGQGVHTALMMLVAEELDCAWADVRPEPAAIDPLYGNVVALSEGLPFRPDDDGVLARGTRWMMRRVARQLGFMMTGGSSSIRDAWGPMREAAAIARATLVDAVAAHWSVPPDQVSVADSVFSAPDGRRMPLGDVVRLLGRAPVPAGHHRLKPPEAFRLIGRALPRPDTASRLDGSIRYAADIRRPGMLFAAVRMAPVRGGTLLRFDADAARAMPGVAGVVPFGPAHGGSGGVAVVADRYWRARKALDALDAGFDDGPMGGQSGTALIARLRSALDTEDGFTFWRHGDVAAAFAAGGRRIDADYSAPWLAHATMEPMNCTVEYRGDSATVWAPTQVPGFARRAAATALGLDPAAVTVEIPPLGTGFGRRLEVDFVAQAATVARAFPGRAVQLSWQRDDDFRHDFYRPACVSRFSAVLDSAGRISAWRNLSAGQAVTPQFLPRVAGLPGLGPDKTAAEGAYDQAYEFPAASVAHVRVDLPVPVGYWRSVGHSHHAFFREGFLDECAHAAGADPLDYRMALLSEHPRERAVLQLAADRAGWGTPPGRAPDGAPLARGIALHASFETIVAQVAEVSIGPGQTIRVHRIVCAIDCGLPVNPGIIRQQIEGAVVFGLSAALYGRIDIEDGRIVQQGFGDQPVLRLADSPQVDVHIVPATGWPGGVGEPGVPPVAPAVAGAVFALTGQRLRDLPLQLAPAAGH